MKRHEFSLPPDRISSYFRQEWLVLLAVTLSGLVYNLGLLATPWFEGRLAQALADILGGESSFSVMAVLAAAYLVTTLVVQGARFVKRFYVRRFANNINRRMKGILFANLLRQSRNALEQQGAGELMTKAISDVDDCAEGMRKFTTELFDTGVALVGYTGMLAFYDWRLALLCLLFPPISYFCAQRMKGRVQRSGAAYKKAAAGLSTATLDRAENAVTYRVYGCEKAREERYEAVLREYARAAVRANVWQSALPPLYLVLSNFGVVFILWYGSRNVLGRGWQAWDIAAFTTFLSCYGKLAVKSSKAAKLFHAVQRAQVSWKRIQPLMRQPETLPALEIPAAQSLTIENLRFSYDGHAAILRDICLEAAPGDIIGVTGPVACGKSTFGKVFLCEHPYGGSIRLNGRELSRMSPREIADRVGYLGHDPELWNDTVENNVLWGQGGDAMDFLRQTALDREVGAMEQGVQTVVGSSGVRLSGGQAQRLALARTLAHPRPLLILDDPFSALDKETEDAVFRNLQQYARDKIVILISHRLYHFPEMRQVLFLQEGHAALGTHRELCQAQPGYRSLYESQTGGENHGKT